MPRNLFTAFISAAALLSAPLLVSSPASAATCSTPRSFFGTVQKVNGSVLTLRAPNGNWADVRIESGARVHTNGYSIRPGVYVGAFGCVMPSGLFEANEITLASNAASYSRTLSGVITQVASDRLVVRQSSTSSSNARWGTWYLPDTNGFRVGQTVTGTGYVSAGGTFYPQTINGRSLAYYGRTGNPEPSVTLSGVVQRVSSNAIYVWEPQTRHTGRWFVADASRFARGERVTGTGTENHSGDFYPWSVHIQ
jgi:hypothetical protein